MRTTTETSNRFAGATWRGFALAAFLLLPLACGDNRAIINVDLDSFVDEGDRRFEYVVLPLGTHAATSPIESVETPSGLRDIAKLEAMSVDAELQLDNTLVLGEVSMAARLEVYVAADDDSLTFWVPENRLATLAGDFTGGQIDTLQQRFDVGDFLPLFQNNDTVYLGLRFQVDHTGGTGAIDGEALVTKLHLCIEAREDLF